MCQSKLLVLALIANRQFSDSNGVSGGVVCVEGLVAI